MIILTQEEVRILRAACLTLLSVFDEHKPTDNEMLAYLDLIKNYVENTCALKSDETKTLTMTSLQIRALTMVVEEILNVWTNDQEWRKNFALEEIVGTVATLENIIAKFKGR